jgi:hypothetical protein
MRNETLSISLSILVITLIIGLVSDFYVSKFVGWTVAHTFSHFCYGLGFPFLFALLFVEMATAKSSDAHLMWMKRWFGRVPMWISWLMRLSERVLSWVGNGYWVGFWVGVFATEILSIRGEIGWYYLNNPAHGSDWHHWLADLLGIVAAYWVSRGLTNKSVVLYA